jgi:hypothetical protein
MTTLFLFFCFPFLVTVVALLVVIRLGPRGMLLCFSSFLFLYLSVSLLLSPSLSFSLCACMCSLASLLLPYTPVFFSLSFPFLYLSLHAKIRRE